MHPLRVALRVASGVLIASALVMVNLAIYFSSYPDEEQMGWAIFCGFNAIWIAVVGVLCLVYAESREMEMKQLDRNRKEPAGMV